MADSYDLSKLGTEAFENIINLLALKTLGLGVTGFGPGADGGRDGYFEGETVYPSETERWKGVWYIQSKFHASHLSKDPQKWLISQVKSEIKKFEEDETDRIWPDNWIIATNIDPSGKPNTGSFDQIRNILNESKLGEKVNLDIWGGRKILDMLVSNNDVAEYYGHFLTPGHVLSALYRELNESKASVEEIIRYFVATQFTHHTYSKLDQAGSSTDERPGVHDLFIDLPFKLDDHFHIGLLGELCKASAHSHRYSLRSKFPDAWTDWLRELKRSRVLLVKGGPGQGKSTIGQYFCQIHRAFLILSEDAPRVIQATKDLAKQVRSSAKRDGFWPTEARIPIQIELKEFAHWNSQREFKESCGVLNYLSEVVTQKIGSDVSAKTIKNILGKQSWIIVFDGLDEVPNDSKSDIAHEILYFLNEVVVEIDGDVFALCTSRPQGYSGQFSGLDGPTVELSLLDKDQAMSCAEPLLKFGRNADESEKSIQTLVAAINSPNVKELMTTPLQSHIMAVVVRDGGRPPERRWQLFNSFYQVMKKRESLKDFKSPRIAKLLREDDLLLKSVHMRLGFVLHAKAERSDGAQTTLNKDDFRKLVNDVVTELVDYEIQETVEDVMEATTERLVLVSTPENGDEVRFDIRQLQEFFASEFIHTEVDSSELGKRIAIIAGDQHWREVMHFLMSALIENRRPTDVSVAIGELRKLNEGDKPNCLYHRRASKAVLLCNRLLLEGVLEQDLRIRQRIKPLLDPLGGRLDIDSLKDLIHIKPISSKKWLIQVLIEKISTTQTDEHIAALYLLAWLPPDNDLEIVKVVEAFSKSPNKIKERLFSLWVRGINPRIRRKGGSFIRESNDKELGDWLVKKSINILNSNDWTSYSKSTIKDIINICFSNKERFISLCEEENINLEMSSAIINYFSNDYKEQAPTETIDIGFIEATLYPCNWKNGLIPKALEKIKSEDLSDSLNGFFKLLMLCVSFAKKKDNESLVNIITYLDTIKEDYISCLPDYLLAMIPISGEQEKKPFCFEHLRGIKKYSNTTGAIEAKNVGINLSTENLIISDDSPSDVNEWLDLAERFPVIAVSVLFNYRTYLNLSEKECVSEIFSNQKIQNVILDNMSETCINIGSWGILVEKDNELLIKLKEKAKHISKLVFSSPSLNGGLRPFPISYPDDVHLLPLIAQAIMKTQEQNIIHRDLQIKDTLNIEETYASYGLNIKLLKDVAITESFGIDTRAGALALYWLFLGAQPIDTADRITFDVNCERLLFKELVNKHNEKWLTQSLISGILSTSKESDDGVLVFVSDLLESCAGGNGPSEELIKLFRIWQERSTAPVNSHGALAHWLGYSYEAPEYAN